MCAESARGRFLTRPAYPRYDGVGGRPAASWTPRSASPTNRCSPCSAAKSPLCASARGKASLPSRPSRRKWSGCGSKYYGVAQRKGAVQRRALTSVLRRRRACHAGDGPRARVPAGPDPQHEEAAAEPGAVPGERAWSPARHLARAIGGSRNRRPTQSRAARPYIDPAQVPRPERVPAGAAPVGGGRRAQPLRGHHARLLPETVFALHPAAQQALGTAALCHPPGCAHGSAYTDARAS